MPVCHVCARTAEYELRNEKGALAVCLCTALCRLPTAFSNGFAMSATRLTKNRVSVCPLGTGAGHRRSWNLSRVYCSRTQTNLSTFLMSSLHKKIDKLVWVRDQSIRSSEGYIVQPDYIQINTKYIVLYSPHPTD